MYVQSENGPNNIRNSSEESVHQQPARSEAGADWQQQSPLASKMRQQFPTATKVEAEDPLTSKHRQYAQQSPTSTRARTFGDLQSPRQPHHQPPHQQAYQPQPHQPQPQP